METLRFASDRVVDILEEYAPFLCDRCAKEKPLATAVFCRRMIFDCNGTRHQVVQRLRLGRDVLRGNHWTIGIPMEEVVPHARIPPHAP